MIEDETQQNQLPAEMSDRPLSTSETYSDRYVYSNYFVPLLITFNDQSTPILPFYVKQQIVEVLYGEYVSQQRLMEILTQLGYAELWDKNEMTEAKERWWGSPGASDGNPNGDGSPTVARPSREVATVLETEVARRTVLAEQSPEFIAGLLQSNVGLAFLDRTRIRPKGFAVGEHVYALGLAPGEEVTLEQKTFTKRQVTLEEQTEQEKQFDIELSSTYTTEIQQGVERQRSLSDSWGLNASHTGQYSSPELYAATWGKINASHTIGYTKNVTEASQESARRSVKDGQTATSKVSARYRTLHKTTFKVSEERGFETTSKRVVRNPNRYTPITLHYFKVLQRLQMMQERYGVRLCWTPSIKDPALKFFGKLRDGPQRIIEEAKTKLPPAPVEPPATDPSGTPSSTKRETKAFSSPIVVADKWGTWGDMRADYDVDIPYDTGYTWGEDGDVAALQATINVITQRPQETVSRWVVGTPYPIQDQGGNKLRVRVHIGAPAWIAGPGISFQISASLYKDVSITQQTSENTKYNADLATYRTALKDWTDRRDAALAKAQAEADDLAARLMNGLSPINEMVGQVIEEFFPRALRDDRWEVDYWQRLFEWERASFVTYPSWWSTAEMRDPQLDPSDFINASWAKLYLPVRVGMERLALRWIFGKGLAVPLSAEVEGRFDALVEDVRNFRESVIGAPEEVVELETQCQDAPEKYRCLATWTELMPTDGTHIEVVRAATSAADAVTQREIADAESLRKALVESEQRSAWLKDAAQEKMTEPATIEVHVGAGGSQTPEPQ